MLLSMPQVLCLSQTANYGSAVRRSDRQLPALERTAFGYGGGNKPATLNLPRATSLDAAEAFVSDMFNQRIRVLGAVRFPGNGLARRTGYQ